MRKPSSGFTAASGLIARVLPVVGLLIELDGAAGWIVAAYGAKRMQYRWRRATTETPREQSPQRRAANSRLAGRAREQLLRGDDVPALCLGDGLEQLGLQVGG